jgi:nicotinate-nucleotide--dimethylbenzimidazole phosphoribosyltransferase
LHEDGEGAMTQRKPVASLAEIRALVAELPGPDRAAAAAAAAREARLTKPAGALGRLEDARPLARRLAGPPSADHPPPARRGLRRQPRRRRARRLGLPAAVTAQMVKNFVAGGAAVNQVCRAVDAELRVYEMDLDRPTADFTAAPAMADEECARAMAYGMMAVEPGIDLLALGEMGIANTTSGSALGLALFGGTAEDWTGPGTGVAGDALARKRAAVAEGVARHGSASGGDGLEILRRLGGFELAAIAGAVLAARARARPGAARRFHRYRRRRDADHAGPGLLDHCEVAHRSAEPAHGLLCERIGKRPLLDLGMRLGEASGAAWRSRWYAPPPSATPGWPPSRAPESAGRPPPSCRRRPGPAPCRRCRSTPVCRRHRSAWPSRAARWSRRCACARRPLPASPAR